MGGGGRRRDGEEEWRGRAGIEGTENPDGASQTEKAGAARRTPSRRLRKRLDGSCWALSAFISEGSLKCASSHASLVAAHGMVASM